MKVSNHTLIIISVALFAMVAMFVSSCDTQPTSTDTNQQGTETSDSLGIPEWDTLRNAKVELVDSVITES